MLLAGFHWNSSILTIAAIDLQTLLVGFDVHLDTSNVAPHAKDCQIRRLRRGVPRSVEYECIVISSTIETREVGIEDVFAELLWRGEIEEGSVADYANRTGRDFDVVNANVAV